MPYNTRQRQAVLRCLERRPEEALTACEIAEVLRRDQCPVGLATVYRQLERLEETGRVHRVDTGEGALYQFCVHGGARACFLLRCEACGRMVHLDCSHLEELCQHLAADHRFRVDPRRTILTGLCDVCGGEEAPHGAT